MTTIERLREASIAWRALYDGLADIGTNSCGVSLHRATAETIAELVAAGARHNVCHSHAAAGRVYDELTVDVGLDYGVGVYSADREPANDAERAMVAGGAEQAVGA